MKHFIAAATALTLTACTMTTEPPVTSGIPAALQGNWGLTALDCVPDRGDAKGLIIVDATSVKFYESRGVLTTTAASSPTSVSGTFAFTGEGQTWTRQMSLRLADSTHLVRSETGADALPAPLTYAKCP
jgi:hypothetical protein